MRDFKKEQGVKTIWSLGVMVLVVLFGTSFVQAAGMPLDRVWAFKGARDL